MASSAARFTPGFGHAARRSCDQPVFWCVKQALVCSPPWYAHPTRIGIIPQDDEDDSVPDSEDLGEDESVDIYGTTSAASASTTPASCELLSPDHVRNAEFE